MKRIILLIISTFVLSISYAIGQTHNETTSEDTIKSFLTKMHNDKLYEDYDFLQKHCSPELLQKLQDAYPYDSEAPAYATWLFRSGQQDSKPCSDGKTKILDVTADGDWYTYKALDIQIISFTMKRIVLIIISIFALFVSYGITQTEDTDSTVMAFCELTKHLMPDIKLDPSAIKAYIMSAEKENTVEGEDLLNIVTAGKYYTPLCSCDIYPYMKEQMCEEALAAFYGVYDSLKTDFKTALKAIKGLTCKVPCLSYPKIL